MKKKIILAILVIAISVLWGQNVNPFTNIRHSSVDADGFLHLRFNGLQATQEWNRLFYTHSDIWEEADIEFLGNGVFEALVPYEFGQCLKYRMQTLVEVLGTQWTYLHSAHFDQDFFPPTLEQMAKVTDDPVGDCIMADDPDLDYTGSYYATSDNRIYRAMTNVTGEFPTWSSFTEFNLWMSGVANLASPGAHIYAMVYCSNIPMVVSPGLYKLAADWENYIDFQRLGDIQSTVSNGALFLSCSIDDLVADPDFGEWDENGMLLSITDFSMKLSVSLTEDPDIQLGDVFMPSMVYHPNLRYEVAENTLPTLELVSYEAPGLAELRYFDAEGDIPLEAIHISKTEDGTTHADMTPIYNLDGSISFYETAANHSLFRVSDNLIDYVMVDVPYVFTEDESAPQLPGLCLSSPNPLLRRSNSCEIRMDGLKSTPATLSLYNMRGQKLQDISQLIPKSSSESIIWQSADFHKLPQGLYFLRLQQDGNAVSKKITIIH